MGKLFLVVGFVGVMFAFTAFARENYETDSIKTSAGNLEITFIGHGTLMFTFGGAVIHVDPWSRLADYSKMPKADIILLTHLLLRRFFLFFFFGNNKSLSLQRRYTFL